KSVAVAWMPWILLSVLVFSWGLPPVKQFMNGGTKKQPNFLAGRSYMEFKIPGLDQAVVRTPPVTAKPTPDAAVYVFNPLSATGTSLILAGFLSGLLLGFSPGELFRILAQ